MTTRGNSLYKLHLFLFKTCAFEYKLKICSKKE